MAAAAGSSLLFYRERGWICSRQWDLTLIIGSAVLVPLPLLFASLAQATGWMTQEQAIEVINIAVAALIGGPHLFSTVTFTFLNRSFLKRRPLYAACSFLLNEHDFWRSILRSQGARRRPPAKRTKVAAAAREEEDDGE